MKRFLVFVFCIAALVALFSFTANAATEYTEGYYTYTVTDGKAKITKVDTAISGDVVIPSTLGGYPVTSIGSYAFQNCFNLTGVIISDNIESISGYAFWFTGLTKISISNKVTSIGAYAFYNTPYYNNASNWENDILYIDNHLIKVKETLIDNFVIRNGTKTIAACAFQFSDLTEIMIPNSVVSIEYQAFSDCNSLTSITIPDSLTYIGTDAFSGCDNLTHLNIDSIESWLKIDFSSYSANPLYYANNLYLNGDMITEVFIPQSITEIKKYAFVNYYRLTSITIPDSVISIGDNAFSSCSNLASITIPNSVTSIGDNAFASCTNLTSITIPDSVEFIGDSAFSNCANLTTAKIGNGVTSFGNETFFKCSNLTSVTISDGVTTIGDAAFSNCSNLTSITIPNSIVSIGNSAFYMGANHLDIYYIGTSVEWSKIRKGEYWYYYPYTTHYINIEKWAKENTYHYHKCIDCNKGIDFYEHIVTNGSGVCFFCGFVVYAIGDVDGEEGITANDAIYLLYNVFFGNEAYPIDQSCDFDGDRSVTANDAIYLLYHVFFGDESYPLV